MSGGCSDSECVDASDIPLGLLLAALYNHSRPVGMGLLKADARVMSEAAADAHLQSGKTYFDYLKGRPLKVQLRDPACINPHGFDRDNGGRGALLRIVEGMRASRAEEGCFSLPPPAQEIPLKSPAELTELVDATAASFSFTTFTESEDSSSSS